jgi:hypothetical protein
VKGYELDHWDSTPVKVVFPILDRFRLSMEYIQPLIKQAWKDFSLPGRELKSRKINRGISKNSIQFNLFMCKTYQPQANYKVSTGSTKKKKKKKKKYK